MCSPAIGAFATLAGGVVSSMGASSQAAAQEAEYKARAAMDKRQSAIERIKGSYEAARVRDKGERIYGAQRAGFAEAGVTPEGSVTEVISDSVSENELDVQAVMWGQEIAADNYNYQSKIETMNAKQAKKAGTFAALSPILSSFSTLGSIYS